MFVGNVYAPHLDLETKHAGIIERFYNAVKTHLSTLPPQTELILGGDYNATVGVRSTECDKPILGPHGIGVTNEPGEFVLTLAPNCALRVANMYFKAKRYHTFRDWRTGHRQQLDMFLISQRVGRLVTDARTYQPRNGIISDQMH